MRGDDQVRLQHMLDAAGFLGVLTFLETYGIPRNPLGYVITRTSNP